MKTLLLAGLALASTLLCNLQATAAPPGQADDRVCAQCHEVVAGPILVKAVPKSPVELQMGFVRVIVEPAEAAREAQWRVYHRGSEWMPPVSRLAVAPGRLRVSLSDVQGFTTPEDCLADIENGKVTEVVARYRRR